MKRTSTFCKADQPMCVEVAGLDRDIVTVSSSVGLGSAWFTRGEWEAFVRGVKAGEFDLEEQP